MSGVTMSYILQVLPSLLNGAIATLQVFCIVIILSIPLGAILAFLMQIRLKPLQWLLTLYVWVMRGTPLLLQLIFFYYVLPSVGIVFDRMPAAILAFTLNYAAYFAEIFRGGIEAIPKGQYEAAKVLKFSQLQTIRYIILPQVFKIVMPSVFNEIINLVKDSSLVYVLGVGDLLMASKIAANRDATLAPMFIAGAIYLILIGVVTVISKRAEKKFSYYR
jgi:polar amino acid transport system permease protein